MVVFPDWRDLKPEGHEMTHQETLWLLQSCWEAVKALGPVAILAFLTWRVAR